MLSRWLMLSLALAICACAAVNGSVRADQPPGAKIDPKCIEVMKAMAKEISGLKQYAIEAEETIDETHEHGSKVQTSHIRNVTVRKPNGVHSTTSGDQQRCFWYDGKTATIHERDKNVYMTIPVPGTIEKMMDELHEKYGVSVPLAELLMDRPDAMMMDKVDYGYYLGEHNADGVKCHHLLFTQRDLDWQIWIDAGAKPLPKKLVITYTKMHGDPQYMAVIKKWDLNPAISADRFTFKAPPGAAKADVLSPKSDK
jgi:hypothetical protein